MLINVLTIVYIVILATQAYAENTNSGKKKDDESVLYMDNHCRLYVYKFLLDKKRFYIDSSVTLKLSRWPREVKILCVATFAARPVNHHLLLHFESVAIDYHDHATDKLRVFDGLNADHELTLSGGIDGKYAQGKYEVSQGRIHDYVSLGEALTLFFTGRPTTPFYGFEATLTVFKDPLYNGTCEMGYFRCHANLYCIPRELVCNSINNCGAKDNSDEAQCQNVFREMHPANSKHYELRELGLLMGCGLSILIFLVVLLWLGVVGLRRVGLRRDRHRFLSSFLPPVPPQSPALDLFVPAPPPLMREPPPQYTESGPTPSQPAFDPPPPYFEQDPDCHQLLPPSGHTDEDAEAANTTHDVDPVTSVLTHHLTEDATFDLYTPDSAAAPQSGRMPQGVLKDEDGYAGCCFLDDSISTGDGEDLKSSADASEIQRSMPPPYSILTTRDEGASVGKDEAKQGKGAEIS